MCALALERSGRAAGGGVTVEQTGDQFSRRQVLLIWVVAALPMGFLAWIVTPVFVALDVLPPALVFWGLTLLGSIWEGALALWLLQTEGRRLGWQALREGAWLAAPSAPRSGPRRLRAYLWLGPAWLVAGLTVGLGSLVTCFALMGLLKFEAMWLQSLLWPAYMNVTELGSPEYAAKWWLLAPIGLGWLVSTFFGEELLFRGVLLPRMSRSFGRWDWSANALLFGLYHLHKPWMIPFRVLGSLLPAALSRRYRSLWLAFGMRLAEGLALLGIVIVGVTSVDPYALPATVSLPQIQVRPVAMAVRLVGQASAGAATAVPVDAYGADLSGLDLSGVGDALVGVSFDTRTIWPPSDRMPADYDPAVVLALGKDPGLGLRALHERGVDGRGVGIAIVDQVLLTEHQEYADRLLWYEETNPDVFGEQEAAAHGSSVASIAVGATVGVAPKADLYYVGLRTNLKQYAWYGHNTAQAIRRIVALNDRLPADRRIRVISISQGWGPRLSGYHDVSAAVREAEAKGLLVVYSGSTYGPEGLGRAPLADPNAWTSYTPGRYWAADFFAGIRPSGYTLVPMDSRTTAAPTGVADYEFGRYAGISWAIPYQAGLYALAAQVDPGITPARFLQLERQTGRTVPISRDGVSDSLGPVVDPAGLIAAIEGRE